MISNAVDRSDTESGTAGATVRLRLFVARGSPYSVRAEAAVRRVCAAHPEGRVDLEVTDVIDNPRASLQHNIFVTPTLIRLEPAPVLRLTGPFDNDAMLSGALGL